MPTDKPPGSEDPHLISYLSLRRAVGGIGMALPLAVALGKTILEGPGLLSSVSAYYYTVMRGVFVGSLCSIAVFLLCYRGYERADAIAGNIAGTSALGVALFPTTPDGVPTSVQRILGVVHYTCAAVLFLALAYFCLFLFRKTNPRRVPTTKKRQRNVVYVVCGAIILVSIALIGFIALLNNPTLDSLHPVFFLESISIGAFGFSWLTKGEAILSD